MAARTAGSGKSGSSTRASTTKKSTSTKPARAATKLAPGSASAAAAAAARAEVAGESAAESVADSGGAELKKRELIDEVVRRSGVRKKFAKPVIEAMIDVLGEAIAEGREVNLQPFGKIKQQRTKDTANARITVARIRQSKSAGPALDPEDRADDDNSNETVAETVE
ncbi:MAG: HU family DNA-binding protein [Roseovarius sp.]|uniref:HU family DNA-binding protein n=1 Tax=Roseobacteraceae TaxID=2854170 RepID=UPI0032EB2F8A